MPKYLLKGLKEVEFPDYGRHTNSIEESLEGNRQRLRHMWTVLREHGASKEQAAAVLGNFYKESWGNYNEERKSNGAYGLAQLLYQRKAAYLNYLKENGIDFALKPVVCDGIEQCKIALIRKNKNLLDANFIEGMACSGGCIGGAGCLTHSGKNKAEFEKYSNNAKPKSIKESVSNAKDTKK